MSCEAFSVVTETNTIDAFILKSGTRTQDFLTDTAAAGVFVRGDLVSIDPVTAVASHAASAPTAGERIAICAYGFDARVSALPNQTLRATFYTSGTFNKDLIKLAGVALSAGEKLAYTNAASIQGIELTTAGLP